MKWILLDSRKSEIFVWFFLHFYEQRKYSWNRLYEDSLVVNWLKKGRTYSTKLRESLTQNKMQGHSASLESCRKWILKQIQNILDRMAIHVQRTSDTHNKVFSCISTTWSNIWGPCSGMLQKWIFVKSSLSVFSVLIKTRTNHKNAYVLLLSTKVRFI